LPLSSARVQVFPWISIRVKSGAGLLIRAASNRGFGPQPASMKIKLNSPSQTHNLFIIDLLLKSLRVLSREFRFHQLL